MKERGQPTQNIILAHGSLAMGRSFEFLTLQERRMYSFVC
jgi:hypothetical protein